MSNVLGYLPFRWKNQKFWLGNQLVCIIPFGKFKKLWAAGSSDTCFPLFFIFPADVGCIFTVFLLPQGQVKSFDVYA